MRAIHPKAGLSDRFRTADRKTLFVLPAAFFSLLLFISPYLAAVPASPEPAELSQADGSRVKVFLKGDEYYHWHEDEGGYTIVRDTESRNWVYARKDPKGSLKRTAHRVGKADPGKLGLTKHLLDAEGVSSARALRSERDRLPGASAPARPPSVSAAPLPSDAAQRAPITQGTMKNLVILARFSDQTTTYSQAQFDSLFNQAGYVTDGAVGSVRDFYAQASYGKLTMQTTVTQWVTLPNTAAYYGTNSPSSDYRARELITDAINALDAAGFDFTTVDGNGDNEVDGLDVIHSGHGEEFSGNSSNYIWSHKGTLASPVYKDGVKMQMYHTESEVRGWDSMPTTWGITRIGVICHETGHFLGLPDLYDYGGDSKGAGNFCLMAGGAWNGNYGTSPAHPSAYCKSRLGWATPAALASSGTYSLSRIEDNDTAIYKFSGASFASTEYFLMENKQNFGFDSGLPGSSRGILIWHVDETVPDYGANDNPAHYKVDLEEASGTQHLETNANSGDDSDYFRSTTMTSFGDNTTPNSRNYAGAGLYWYVQNISASGNPMTFSYGAIDATPPSAVPSVSDGAGADIAYTSSGTQLSANWPASSDPESGILRYWYAIGTTPGGTEKLGWTNNGTNLSFTRTGLSLTNGQIYYVSVKAENYQGLISNITTSNGQTADTTAPAAPGAINDGLGADITYTSSGTQLSANWTAGSDAESGVARYWYAIGTTAGGTNTAGWTDNGTSTTATRTGLTLIDGQIYYFTVKTENGSGLKSAGVSSNGQRPDTTPPAAPGAVNDGSGGDLAFTSTPDRLSANWAASSDAQSGVARYWYAIGSAAGGTDISGWTDNGTSTSATRTGLSLGKDPTYYFAVKAENGAGLLSAAVNSDGQRLADTQLAPAFTQVYTSSLTAAWTAMPGAEYIVALATGTDFANILSSSQQSGNSASFGGLSAGTRYFFEVRLSTEAEWNYLADRISSATLAIVPALPPGSAFAPVYSDSATVSWSSGTPAGGYNPGWVLYQAELSANAGFSTVLYSSATYGLSAAFFGLTPNTEYYARSQAVSQNGVPTSFRVLGATITLAVMPAPSPGGAYTELSTASLKVNWSSGTAASGYDPAGTLYRAELSTAADFTAASSSSTVNTSAGFRGLVPNETYYLRVRAENGAGTPTSYAGLGSTATLANPPGPAAYSAVSASGFSANWTANGNSSSTLYRAEISTAADFTGPAVSSVTAGSGAVFSALSHNTTWYGRVRAEGAALSAYTSLSSTVTLAGQPLAAFISAAGTGALTVSWSPNGNPEGTAYQAAVSTASDFSGIALTSATAAGAAGFSGLVPNTTYYARVLAVNHGGQPTPFTVVPATITPAAEPLAGPPSGIGEFSLTANWLPNGNPAWTLYRVELSTGDFSSVQASSDTASLHAAFAGLMADTTYYMRSRAAGNNGLPTAWADLPPARTLLSPPVPSGAAFPAVGVSSAAAAWLSGGNGPGTQYLCQISTDDFATLNFATATYGLSLLFGTGGAGPALRANTAYYFRVRATNGDSSTADVFLGSTVTLVYAPGAAAVLSVTSAAVSLDWSPGGNPEPGTAYEVWRDTGPGFAHPATAESPASALLVGGLAPGTIYYFKVRSVNLAGVFSDFSGAISTRTYPAPPLPIALSGAALGVSSLSWTWGDAGEVDGYRVVSSTDGNISGVLAPGSVNWREEGLSANTAYSRKITAFNISGVYSSSAATLYTLAAPPSAFALAGVYPSSVALAWSGGANPPGTKYEVEYWTAGGSTAAVTVLSTGAALTGLEGGELYASVRALNGDNIPAACDLTLSTVIPATVRALPPNEDAVVVYQGPSGEVRLEVPKGSFNEAVNITLRSPAPGACPSPAGGLTALAMPVCVEVDLDRPGQPAKSAELSVSYRDSDLGGADESKLVLARYDASRSEWVPIFSGRDPAANRVWGQTGHFSVFQIVQSAPARDLSGVSVGPNILRPGRAPGQLMTFRNLPAGARVRIYTLVGELLRDTSEDGTGNAVWNGRNRSGAQAASGVYIALIEAGGKKKVFRVAVER